MYFVYILSEIGGNRTYIGYTVNLQRRLRQHNGEIVGGAKATRGRKWEFAGYLTGFPDSITALQCEWKLKHPFGRKKKLSGIKGKIESLKYIFTLEQLTSNSFVKNCDLKLQLYFKEEYLPFEMPENIEILPLVIQEKSSIQILDILENNIVKDDS